MNKTIIYIIILLFISNCSLSKKENEIEDNLVKIFKKNDPIKKEFNPQLKIKKLSTFDLNPFIKNNTNNNGNINFDTNYENISNYKIRKIKKFNSNQPELFFTDDEKIIFFNGIGSIFMLNKDLQEIWKINNYNKKEKKLNPILYFAQVNKKLVVTDNLSKIYAIDLKDGKVVWTKYGSSSFNSDIKVYKDTFLTIDFDNVIFCSANEGILPKNPFVSTFLPYDLRKKFDLPTIDESDARVSYDFYRLLQRSNNIYITYNSSPEGIDSGEKSRYVYQLELQKNKNYNIHKFVSSFPLSHIEEPSEEYKKTDKLIERLDEISISGFSPSALKDFVENQIRFYERYVLGINESDSVVERAEHRGIGIIFHNAMEEIYKPFVGKKLTKINLKNSLKNVKNILNKKFEEDKCIAVNLLFINLFTN